MENRKGSGLFLGIVSLATLIVAIIGATFAYFSASTESNAGALNLQAYEYQLSLHVEKVYPTTGSAIVPLKPDTIIPNASAPNNTNLLYALNVAENKCVDDSGMQVCVLYKVSIRNDATNEVIMSGKLETTTNVQSDKPGRTPFQNLMYQQITYDQETSTIGLVGEPKPLAIESGGSIDIADIVVEGGETDEYGQFTPGYGYAYVLIYLNDSGENQSGEMGATFGGTVKYISADGEATTLTGGFKVSGTPE